MRELLICLHGISIEHTVTMQLDLPNLKDRCIRIYRKHTSMGNEDNIDAQFNNERMYIQEDEVQQIIDGQQNKNIL